MPWTLNNDRPIYTQLIEQIQQRIISGTYQPGDKLPSVRDLAAEAAVNPNTMQKALTELERMNLVHTNRTSGRIITEDTDMLQQMKYTIAKEHLQDFLHQMEQLGFKKAEIIEFLKKAASDSSPSN